MDPDTKIDDVETGIVIAEPPASCQASTFAARDALQTFSDDLSNILTYHAWLNGELGKACENLKDEILAEIEARKGELETKDEAVTDALENLFQLLGKNHENFVSFTNRMRWEFEKDDTAAKIESDIIVPEVPESCSPATKAARDSL